MRVQIHKEDVNRRTLMVEREILLRKCALKENENNRKRRAVCKNYHHCMSFIKICIWMVESNLQLFFVCVDRLSNFRKSLSGNSDTYMSIWVTKQHKLDMSNWPSIISTPFIEVLGYFDIRWQSMMDWVKTRQKSIWRHWRHITAPWDWLTMLSRPTATSLW